LRRESCAKLHISLGFCGRAPRIGASAILHSCTISVLPEALSRGSVICLWRMLCRLDLPLSGMATCGERLFQCLQEIPLDNRMNSEDRILTVIRVRCRGCKET